MKASKNITKTTLLTILTQFPAHIFGILAGILITRVLGPEGKGLYAIFYANAALFITLFGFTVSNSIIYFIGSKKISEDSLRSIILIILTFTVVTSIISIFVLFNTRFIDLFLPDYKASISLIILFLITILITQINSSFTAYFQGLKHFKIVNQILILNGFYSLIIFAGLYFINRLGYYEIGLYEIVLASLIILVLNTFHWFYYYSRQENVSFKFNRHIKNDFYKFIKFTGLNHIANVLFFLNQRLILWFIAFYLDNWDLGIFSLGIGLAQLVYYFSNPLSLILESFLSSENGEKQSATFSIFSRMQFSIVLLACILASSLSQYILPWLYGSDFRQSATILNIVVFGILLSSQSVILSSLFLATNRLKYNVIPAIVGVVTTVISAPILIQKYGIIGAAYSQLLTYIIIFIIQLFFVRTKMSVDFNLFFITRSDIRYFKSQLKLAKIKKKELEN